ncbi:hypothetical protein ACFLV2_01425 [Chloroflexota bacterium]
MMEVSSSTLDYYCTKLGRFLFEFNADTVTRDDIETFLLQFENPGNRHAYYRAIKTFYNWRYQIYDLPSPVKHLKAPRLGKLIMPSLTAEQVEQDKLELAAPGGWERMQEEYNILSFFPAVMSWPACVRVSTAVFSLATI